MHIAVFSLKSSSGNGLQGIQFTGFITGFLFLEIWFFHALCTYRVNMLIF
jgi:hypothetical protein